MKQEEPILRDESGVRSFRQRGRKLRLAFGALGLLLALVVVFLLVPDRGSDDAVRIQFVSVGTNKLNQFVASFVVTNTGERAVRIYKVASEQLEDGQWFQFDWSRPRIRGFGQGQSAQIDVRIHHHSDTWRGKVFWYDEPTRFQRLWLGIKETPAAILGTSSSTWGSWWEAHAHTNYSPEFIR